MTATPWLDTWIDRLRDLCASAECGNSNWIARRLNDEFGTTFTKNAIIGKMLRNKIIAPHPKNPVRVKKQRKPIFNFAKPAQIIVEDSPAIMPTEFPHKCDLFGLTNETCRWPVNDPGTSEFFFCGQPEADLLKRQPYCRAHTWAAYKRNAA